MSNDSSSVTVQVVVLALFVCDQLKGQLKSPRPKSCGGNASKSPPWEICYVKFFETVK